MLGTVEIMTTTLAFGLVGIAALIAAGAGYWVGAGPALQFGAFVLASAVGLGVARPFALRHIRQPPLLRTGTAALVGRSAIVLEEVTARTAAGSGSAARTGRRVPTTRPQVIPAGLDSRRPADRGRNRARVSPGVA